MEQRQRLDEKMIGGEKVRDEEKMWKLVWKRSRSAVPSDRKIDVSENSHRRILADFQEREREKKSNEKLFTRRNGTFFFGWKWRGGTPQLMIARHQGGPPNIFMGPARGAELGSLLLQFWRRLSFLEWMKSDEDFRFFLTKKKCSGEKGPVRS